MRLLNVHDLELHEFYDDSKRPKYAIASHRWQMPFEATYKDILKNVNTEGLGYRKVLAFCNYVRESIPRIDWIWIDTCCIDKKNATELQTSINLMFKWYRDAEICLAYLHDVHATDVDALKQSEWFRRGWTLQELVAPRTVVFLTSEWQIIGRKGPEYAELTSSPLDRTLSEITRISEAVLLEYNESLQLTVKEKMTWMDGRVTTLPEDRSYALYGICNVCPGVNYGEGGKEARERLLSAINRQQQIAIDRAGRFDKIQTWLAPPDTWTNHDTARQRHEPGTGAWLLHSDEFRRWKLDQGDYPRHLWVYGPPGCGKTILASTAIEDVRAHCETKSEVAQAIFYFTFSDISKQTYDNLVRSLLAQLSCQGQESSLLEKAYENGGKPSWDALERILSTCIASYQTVFLHIDALDECRSGDDVRVDVLARLEELLVAHPNIRMIATSRDVIEVRTRLERLNAPQLCASSRVVDPDVHRYLATQMSRDPRFSSLQRPTRDLIQDTLAEKANGMFRWAYCQLEELRKFKSTKPSSIKAALQQLPKTLDDTYERMLSRISQCDQADAITLLRCVTFAERPMSLDELAEATIIDLATPEVHFEDRGDWRDSLSILSGLVLVEAGNRGDWVNTFSTPSGLDRGGLATSNPGDGSTTSISSSSSELRSVTRSHGMTKNSTIRLAHFSVQEYLLSSRILESDVRGFHLDPAREHGLLARSCLIYLLDWCRRPNQKRTDVIRLPLLRYACRSWDYHSMLKGPECDVELELELLASSTTRQHWLRLCNPVTPWRINDIILIPEKADDGVLAHGGLYYASLLGLENVVVAMLKSDPATSDPEDKYGEAFDGALERGHVPILRLLIENNFTIDEKSRRYSNALAFASHDGQVALAKLLLDKGTNPNHGYPLLIASISSRSAVVKLLIDAGANVQIQVPEPLPLYDEHGNELPHTHENDVAYSLRYSTDEVFEFDFEFSEDTYVAPRPLAPGRDKEPTPSHRDGTALHIAASNGDIKLVTLLIEHGADVNAVGGPYHSPLQIAAHKGHVETVKFLLSQGADANFRGGLHGNAIVAACINGHATIVDTLIRHGADVNSDGGQYGQKDYMQSEGQYHVAWTLPPADTLYGGLTPVAAAAIIGRTGIVELLLQQDAQTYVDSNPDANAFAAAVLSGSIGTLELLLDKAKVNSFAVCFEDALCTAVNSGHMEMVDVFTQHGITEPTIATAHHTLQ